MQQISYTEQILLKKLTSCNLCQCSPSSFHYGLSVSFQCFSVLVHHVIMNYYFQVSVN